MKPLYTYLIIGATTLTAGAAGGVVYKQFIADPTENIIGFNPDNCKPDGDALIAGVEKCSSAKEATNKFRPYEIALYGLETYKRAEYSVSFSTGLADTIVAQVVKSAQIRNGDKFFEESLSKSSMVGVAKRMIQEGVGGKTKIWHETGTSDIVISDEESYGKYKTDNEELGFDEYKEKWGKNLEDMFIYLIHSSTVDNEEIKAVDGGYIVSLQLQPTKASYNYRYQMKTISNLEAYPSFAFLDVEYYLDSDLNLVRSHEHSKFNAKMVGVSATVENKIDYYYFKDKKVNIPTLEEKIDYKSLLEEATHE